MYGECERADDPGPHITTLDRVRLFFMAKLAIIFGAGASYDFLATYPPADKASSFLSELRLPLADHLFENRKEFALIASQLRRLIPILPELRHRTAGRPLEEVLEELRSLDVSDPYWRRRQRELMAVRFYVQRAIWWSETTMIQNSAGISNYSTLIGYIERFRRSDDTVILITFNYDTLIERALSLHFDDFTFKSIGDYVSRPRYKLFKLHGSVNWGNPIPADARVDLHTSTWQITNTIIDLADNFDYKIDDFAVLPEPSVVVDNWAYLPAISVPVRKKSNFSCPDHWLPLLDAQLDGVSNLLVVGWSAGEQHFLNRAVPVLNKNPDLVLTVVSSTDASAKDTEARLKGEGLKTSRTRYNPGGFTHFIITDEVKTFLRRGGNVV
jgi:hypothetical protein